MLSVLISGPLLAASVLAAQGDAGPGVVGQWDTPTEWGVIAIHSALLNTGKVLQYSYPGGGPGSMAVLFNPQTGEFTPVEVNTNIFCSGFSLLGDGTLFVAGGTRDGCDFRGRASTRRFDPASESWSAGPFMEDGRWYPTNVTLGDGSVLIFSGFDITCETNMQIERFFPGVGIVPLGIRNLQLFPRLHLLTSGLVVHVGPENLWYAYDPDTDLWQFIDQTNLGWRCDGNTVLIPGATDKILAVGGSCPLTNTAEILDMSSPDPQWQPTSSMHYPRALAPHVYGRMYHATTVLLPDGRVVVAGQDNGPSIFWGEIYNPPYLYRGARPELAAVPQRVSWDRPFSLAVPQSGSISDVALIAPTTVTHSVNNSQRYVDLSFEVIDQGVLRAVAPLNGNHAPPGYYMLFVVDADGVPAVAKFVQIGLWPAGDIDGDGTVGILDFLLTLESWVPCAGCQADLDGDGRVGITDFLTVLFNWS